MRNPIITYLEIIAVLERDSGILIQVYECYAEFKRCVRRKCGIWL